jgi:hypothetical protein
MRRFGIVLIAACMVATLAGPAAAQPKVTITGFIDHVSSWNRNLSEVDLNVARTGDSEWYARTRVRPDITAQVGTTKFVLGLEIDSVWGQTAGQDSGVCLNAACPNAPQHFGATSGWDLNTDVVGSIEVKWAYTELDVPLIPFPTRLTLGAQPWSVLYKGGIYATGDFAGAHLVTQWSPVIRSFLTYTQIEEQSTGPRDGFVRGDDFVITASVEITPFKGLDIRPIVSYANFIGVTSASSRQNRGGLGSGAGVFPTAPAGGLGGAIEDRVTVGVDARWRFGPFFLDPTILYQFGNRDQISPIVSATSGPGVKTGLKRDAWYADFRGGWQAGPLLLEGAVVYTTGNKAEDRIDLNRSRLKYFEPISTDNTFFAVWSEIQSSGIDYFHRIRATAGSLNPGVAMGYDKYGFIIVGARASYAITPAFLVRGGAHARWTAEEVDTASTVAAGTGLTPRCAAAALDAGTCVDRGTARYYGTEANLGFQWRFAPNVALDVVASYFWAGPALSSPGITNPVTGAVVNGRDPQDIQAISSRVRFSF